MAVGWQGTKTRLVPLDTARHFENALAWLNDPEITERTLVGDLPIGRLAEEAYFKRGTSGDPFVDTHVNFAIETLDGTHIGLCSIIDIQWRHGAGQTGTLIGPAEYRGKGYGGDAVAVRTRYAFEVLNLRLLLSQVLEGNPASLKALLKAGYREVGRLPKRYWKRGEYRDSIQLALDRDDWRLSQR